MDARGRGMVQRPPGVPPGARWNSIGPGRGGVVRVVGLIPLVGIWVTISSKKDLAINVRNGSDERWRGVGTSGMTESQKQFPTKIKLGQSIQLSCPWSLHPSQI